MKRILLVLAALAMFAGCKKDSKNEVPTGSFDFTGTMNVVYFDVDYKSEDVVITVDYDKDSGKAELLLHQVKFVPISALMASTVRSSTMALTCAMNEPASVSTKVMATSHRYGRTNGRIFLKSWKRFIWQK